MRQVILYAIMFAFFFGMLWANSQYKGKGVAWGRPLAAVFGILSLLMALTTIITQLTGGVNQGKIEEYREREARYQYIAHKKLGKLIAQKHAGQKALLIKYEEYMPVGEDIPENPIDKAILDGLKEGLGADVEITTEEKVSMGYDMMYEFEGEGGEGMSEEDMMEKMLTSNKFDTLMKANRECKVIISLAGLPMDYQLMKFWRMKDPKTRPALYLVNASIYDMKGPIKAKFINGALVDKPVPIDIEKPVPEDEEEAFNSRYLLITSENVDSVATQFKNMFATKK